MNPRRLVGLYPAPWRHRYGDEFLAVLEERPPRGLDVIDIAWGALDAHLFPQAPEGRFRMFTRLAGSAALVAGLLLVLGAFWDGGPVLSPLRVAAVYVLILVGLIGIHLRQVSVRPGLAWFGFAAAFIGWGVGATSLALTTAGVLPPSGGELGWVAGLAIWIGSVALGASMLAIGSFPLAVGLAITVGAPLSMLGLVGGLANETAGVLDIVTRAGIVLSGLGWMGAGLSLLTAQPREGVLGSAT